MPSRRRRKSSQAKAVASQAHRVAGAQLAAYEAGGGGRREIEEMSTKRRPVKASRRGEIDELVSEEIGRRASKSK